jgi:Rho GTPase-activating protein 1
MPIEDLLIPPSTYLYDRRVSDDIYAPYASGRRAFGARQPFPTSKAGNTRLPRVLRETTNFLLLEENIGAEGLFRVPPHAKLKECLKEAYDRGQKYIVWKDNGATLELPVYPRAEHQDEIIAELDPRDAYSVYMAAGLIKSWYADLRQPIFPQGCYHDLKRLFGDPQDPPDLERLTDLFSPSSEWSFLSTTSRIILTRHLLPLISAVSARQEQNKMTSENIAVCFAPTLLCGPDQLEDAKMSSIIRRILTEAADLWTESLRESCGVDKDAFEEELRLPSDAADWDDPVEGNKTRTTTQEDEIQITGIILQDNEKHPEQPPPLPPRSNKPQPRSASGQSPSDSLTKRKPAPPLQVPPRYSTVISDNPHDVSESPSSYAAVTDGFAPHRPTPWDLPDEKTTGTSRSGDSHHSPPQIALPKRKALTAQQIDNAETVVAQVRARGLSGGAHALPGLVKLTTTDLPKSKTASSSRGSSATSLPVAPVPPVIPPPALSSGLAFPEASERQEDDGFRRPLWAASANRAPQITSLARPVFPTSTVTSRPASKSTSLPVPGPKARTPSPSLIQRMPSFETSKKSPTLAPPTSPRRLNMKKASVDDLRRLYEERTSTAKALVEATKW